MMAPSELTGQLTFFWQVAANFMGGAAVTLLWWGVTLIVDRVRQGKELRRKREAISLELAQIRADLKTLKADPEKATASWPGHSSSALAALVRLGPPLVKYRSAEPKLGNLRYRLGRVTVLASHYHDSVAGIAVALRDNEENVAAARKELDRLVDAASNALDDFESTILTT